MAELAPGIAKIALEKLASKAYEEIGMAKSVKKDLKKLQKSTLVLKSVLGDAEKKQNQDEELRIWLEDLKDLLRDAVDVLDEFDCEVLRRQVLKDFGSFGRKVRRFCSFSNPLAFRFSTAHRVKGIKKRFVEITKDMARFQLIRDQLNCQEEQSHFSEQHKSERMTHSFVKASDVIGRDGDKEELVAMLMDPDGRNSDNNLSVIAIVGLGGLGKTTLAQSVFNDEKVKVRFDLKLWVCVSLDFDVTRLLREILKSANEQDPSSLSLDQLQASVRTTLEGKRFLLVMDDVWNEDQFKWVELRQFLTGGAEGTKVIATTRSLRVSSIMTTAPPHKLQGLSDEDSSSLFFKCSFGDEELGRQNQKLIDIGKEIVKKCRGVPLALKTLGCLLSKKPEAKWILTRDSEIWELEQEDDRILAALRLSYNAMTSSMKQCFAYCSIFPEDVEMNSFKLIANWMAFGFVQSPNGKLELEDVGELQFKELCDRSLLQRTDDDEETMYNLSHECNMHDLIHDLALSISKSECCIVKSGEEDICDTVRNLRLFVGQNSPTIVQSLKKLWSIHFDHSAGEKEISESFLSMCIKQSKYLRLIDLCNLSFEVLPSSIGTLKHLRFLTLSGNKRIKRLPNSICRLQSLQTLGLDRCEALEELPKEIRNLVSLRTLSISTKQTQFLEEGIGRLKSLRFLFIGDCNNLLFLPGDMRYCATLRHLIIKNCQQLDLACIDEGITLSLQTFHIKRLPETTALPLWLKGASNTLKNLVIEKCDNLVALPEWLQDFMSLKRLVIKNCPEISIFPEGMQRLTSLTQLVIRYCDQLKFPTESHRGTQLSLKHISLALPQMTDLPQWLQGASCTLECMDINDGYSLSELPEWLLAFTSLKRLEFSSCLKLSALPEGMSRLTSLTHLGIRQCSSAFHRRYTPDIGEDWESIAHIPNVYISPPRHAVRRRSQWPCRQ